MSTAAIPSVNVYVRDHPHSAAVAGSLILADVFGLFIAAAIAVMVRFLIGGTVPFTFYLHLAPFILLFLATFAITGLYPGIAINPVIEIQRIVKGITFTYLLLVSLSFFQRDIELYSRAIILLAWVLSITTVPLTRMFVRKICATKPWWGTSAVIFGASDAGYKLFETLKNNPQLGIRPVAILDDRDYSRNPDGKLPIFRGPFSCGPELAGTCGVRYAIVALPDVSTERVSKIVESYAAQFHNILIIPNFIGLSTLDLRANDLGGMLGVEVRNQLLHRLPRFVKRCFDLSVALITAIALLPLLVTIWLAIRLTSSGGALYFHERVGEKGKTFKAWKFRSMYLNGDEILKRHLESDSAAREEWEQDHKLKNDPRVTRIGRILRKTSLDEIPQLWNVITGEMSMVGPRPIVLKEIEKYGSKYRLYQRVRPGISGLWQVSGRNNTTYGERVVLDEYYVRNWSIWLDTYILARTVRVVLTGEGAY